MSMKDRILTIMEAHKMNASTFADKIGVGRPTLHHIISGRNQAGVEVIKKICKEFPDVELKWLMFGEGEYIPQVQETVQEDLFGSLSDSNEFDTTPSGDSDNNSGTKNAQNSNTNVNTNQQIENEYVTPQNCVTLPLSEFNILKELSEQAQNRRVEKIMVLYSDGTFQNFEVKG